jgi:hypothetical protein
MYKGIFKKKKGEFKGRQVSSTLMTKTKNRSSAIGQP